MTEDSSKSCPEEPESELSESGDSKEDSEPRKNFGVDLNDWSAYDKTPVSDSKIPKRAGNYLRYSHLGIQFALVFGVCVAAGMALDRKLQWSPLFTILGLFLGFAAALYHLVKAVNFEGHKRDGEDRQAKGA